MSLERTIQRKIIKWLEDQGHYVVKTINSNKKGVPDLLVCLDGGRFCAIEVKRPEGKATELQKYNLNQIKELGGIAMIARSVDDVREMFARHGLMKGDI
jgi:Holliday junction resolvase